MAILFLFVSCNENDIFYKKTGEDFDNTGGVYKSVDGGVTVIIPPDALPDGVQDGILLAKEISDLDLRDADLVVLSACQTGLGDITGEGVFGLQRAFKMAGVRTIVMSLWPVNDKATQILMTALYSNIEKGQSKHEAFRNAQQSVRDYVPAPDEPPTLSFRLPRFWAGFILLD